MYFYMTHDYLMDYACRRDAKFKYSFLISSTINLCCHVKFKYSFPNYSLCVVILQKKKKTLL